MDEHIFYLLEKFFEAGENGIEWSYVTNNITQRPEYIHLEKSKTGLMTPSELVNRFTQYKDNGGQVNVITKAGIDLYNHQKSEREKLDKLKQREDDVKGFDYLHKRFIYRWRWWPFFASAVALIISLSTCAYTCNKDKKETPPEKPEKTVTTMQNVLHPAEPVLKKASGQKDTTTLKSPDTSGKH